MSSRSGRRPTRRAGRTSPRRSGRPARRPSAGARTATCRPRRRRPGRAIRAPSRCCGRRRAGLPATRRRSAERPRAEGVRSVDFQGAKVSRPHHGRPQRGQAQVHRRPRHSGRVRGRDGHPPALHDRHRPPHRRGGDRRVRPPSARLRARPAVREARAALAGRRGAGRLQRDDVHPEDDRDRPGHRAGRQVDGLRAQAQPADRQGTAGPVQRLRRDLDALHAPRLPGALRPGGRALHLPVPRRRLQLPRRGGRRPAGPPARPLLHPRPQRPARDRPALLGQPRAQALLAARSRRGPRRHRAVPLSLAPDGAQDPRDLIVMARVNLPAPPLPKKLNPAPKRPGQGNGKVKTSDVAKEAGTTVIDWLDERTALTGPARWLMFRKVPKGTNWFYTLGSATMFAFLSQAVTGVFLAMYYDPSPTRAYESARFITNDVFLGEFVRGMHKWGSTIMVILIFLHMARTFFFGAYKYPRELNWVIGVVLIILTMVMSFTGYLLPFDQRSYWATIVAVNLNGTAPILGPFLADFLRAGPEFSGTTLSRFYSVHMLLVPGAIAALIGAHLYLVAKLGTTAPPWLRAEIDDTLLEERT